MKTIVLTINLFLLGTAWLYAQPIITAQSNPQIGQAWDVTMLDANGFKPGAAGANQSWDFSAIPPEQNFPTFQFVIIDPSNAPYPDSFPDATHVVKWTLLGFPFHQYEYADNQKRAAVGGILSDGTGYTSMTHYTKDDDDAIQYPLTYQTSYPFTSIQTLKTLSFTFEYFTEGSVEVDAYGSLTLPTGTYDDVLRMRIVRVKHDSTFLPPEVDTTTQIVWMEEGNATPLMVYETYSNPDNGSPALYYAVPSTASSSEGKLSSQSIDIQHLPGSEKLGIQFNGFDLGQHINIQLIDLSGKKLHTIYQGHISTTDLQLPFPSLPKGIFLLVVADKKGLHISQKLIH